MFLASLGIALGKQTKAPQIVGGHDLALASDWWKDKNDDEHLRARFFLNIIQCQYAHGIRAIAVQCGFIQVI